MASWKRFIPITHGMIGWWYGRKDYPSERDVVNIPLYDWVDCEPEKEQPQSQRDAESICEPEQANAPDNEHARATSLQLINWEN